jgi:drug/metabolite transporter (DMT)-like permease
MNWFNLSLIAGILTGIAGILEKYSVNEKSDPVIMSALSCFFAGLFGLCLAFLVGQYHVYWTLQSILGLSTSSLIYTLSVFLFFASLKRTEISEFGILNKVGLLVMFMGGIIIFHERLSITQIIGSILVLVSIYILSNKGKSIKLAIGSIYALISAILGGVASLIDKTIIGYFDSVMYTGLIYLAIFVWTIPFVIIRIKKHLILPPPKIVQILAVSAIVYSLAAVAYYLAYKIGPMSLISIVSQLQLPIVVLYGLFVFKEKDNIKQKVFSLICMLVGAFLINS